MKTRLADEVQLPQIAAQLADVPLFAALTPAQRTDVAQRAAVLEAGVGEVIIRQGDLTYDFFVLLAGEASVSVRVEEAATSVEVGVVLPRDILGELAVILDERRSATVTAQQPCTLLRIDAATFRALAAEMPGFGLALSRELARRFRTALDDKNLLQSEHMPAPIAVRRADLGNTSAYLARYYLSAVQSVLRRHRLIDSDRFPRFEDRFRFSRAEQARWFALFGVGPAEPPPPFTYFTTSATMALMQVLSEIGVNFRHLMHLRSEMSFAAQGHVLEPAHDYTCDYRLTDIMALRSDRVAIVCRVEIRDAAERLMLVSREFFIIRNLEPGYVRGLRRSGRRARFDGAEFQSLSKRQATLPAAQRDDPGAVARVEIAVPDDAGLAYGRVSGDMNMVHTTVLAARLFGHRKPFVQGLFTANHVLHTLTRAAGHPPEAFSITFARKVFVGQAIAILHTASRFEVCDAQDNLLAFGDWRA